MAEKAFLAHVYYWVNALNRFLKALVHEHVKLTPLPRSVYLPSAKSMLWD